MAPLVSVEQLTFSYPAPRADAQHAVASVSFDLEPGEVVLLLGGSGSGKSTVLRALSGLVPHFCGGTFAGNVRVAGRNTRHVRPRDLGGIVGLVFQDPESQAVMNTVEREIAFGLENIGTPDSNIGRLVEESLVALGLSHLRRVPLSTLSGGELQKVMLAATLAMQPQLLLLDEPTSQLDPVSSEELLSALRRLNEDTGTTVVLAEHRVERCLHLAHRVLFMDSGRLVFDGTPQAFCGWAASDHPHFLPPVTRLFAQAGLGSAGAVRTDGPESCLAVLPLTVRDARLQLSLGGTSGPVARRRASGPPPAEAGGGPTVRSTSCHTLTVSGLSVGYPPDAPLLEDVNFELRSGECVALMGENGCGKSTLVAHLNGLRHPLAGRVLIDAQPVTPLSVAEAARLCAVLGQHPSDYFVRDTLADEIDYSLALHIPNPADRPRRREKLLDELSLGPLLARNPRDLSGGERTRAALALLLGFSPPFLVLDEPTRGLDPEAKAALASLLGRWTADGMGVLVVTHDVEFAALCSNRVILLGDGGVLADGPSEQVLDGSLFFSTQINRLLGHVLPGVLRADQVTLSSGKAESAA